tara:strand:+ start:272 stop:451 length:180 start_codon:yes stop_codon:yes gene_type:complete
MKDVKHYKKNGSEHKGSMHKMSNGKLHSGAKHSSSSVRLYHYGELTNKSKTKAKESWKK